MSGAFGKNPGDSASVDEAASALGERAAEGLLRSVLEALCVKAGLSLGSDAEPGTPARNYELALRLGIGEAFGLEEDEPSPLMRQVAPYPEELAGLVDRLRYRRHLGWRVWLEDDCQRDKPGRHKGEARGLTLIVQRHGPNSYRHDEQMRVNHYFAVPAATYNEQSWARWLFDRLGDVDAHERMEDFVLEETATDQHGCQARSLERPFSPNHGPGWDPYLITVERTATDRRTSFRGDVKEPTAAEIRAGLAPLPPASQG
jgi:hypothetical protein